MAGPTSPSLALAVLVLLPFDILTWILRFHVRISRKAWGPDDWSMSVAISLFTISTIGMLGIAFTGGGKRDAELSPSDRETAMFWWFVMQTMFCLAAIPVKWAICFTLLRIAGDKKAYRWSIYVVMAAVAIVMASTTIYEFFHCTPIAMNWRAAPGGTCKAQSNITGFSFALSAVSIFSDWFCAILYVHLLNRHSLLSTNHTAIPIPLLWNVQIEVRVKLSIITLLGLGIFASTAAIVRLTVTLNLSSTTDFLYHAMPVAAWAHAELGLGVILANLSALRPLLEKLLDLRSTLRSSNKKRSVSASGDRYIELEEGRQRKSEKGVSKRLSTSRTREVSGWSSNGPTSPLFDDAASTTNVVAGGAGNSARGIQVNREFDITYEHAEKQ